MNIKILSSLDVTAKERKDILTIAHTTEYSIQMR